MRLDVVDLTTELRPWFSPSMEGHEPEQTLMARKQDQRLVSALRTLLDADPRLSENALARSAGVAPQTLRKVLAHTFVKFEGPLTEVDPRQKRAWAEALTRLAMHVAKQSQSISIEPEDAVAEAGLSCADREIAMAIERARSGHKARLGLSDDVLDNIAARARSANHLKEARIEGVKLDGLVWGAILQWDPFFSLSSRTIHDSWADKFCRRLLGSLNPTQWWIHLIPETSISRALTSLSGGVDSVDLVFGVYDTVSRRLGGYNFINIPGIGVPLHALYSGPAPTWETIAARQVDGGDGPYATVLKGDVGELYLRGACQYPDRDVQALDVFKHDEIADRLVATPGPVGRTSLFVADRPTCLGVEEALRKVVRSAGPDSDRARLAKSFFAVDGGSPEKRVANTVPVYRLGVALRAGAETWTKLLTVTLEEELFRNDQAWTVEHYLSLVLASYNYISLLPLEPQLSPSSARSFASHFMQRARERRADFRDGDFDQLVSDATFIWDLPEQPPVDMRRAHEERVVI